MAVARALLLVQALLLASLVSAINPPDGEGDGLVSIPQMRGPGHKPVTNIRVLAQGAPLYVYLLRVRPLIPNVLTAVPARVCCIIPTFLYAHDAGGL